MPADFHDLPFLDLILFQANAVVEVTTGFARHADAAQSACDDGDVLPRPFGDNSFWSFLAGTKFESPSYTADNRE